MATATHNAAELQHAFERFSHSAGLFGDKTLDLQDSVVAQTWQPQRFDSSEVLLVSEITTTRRNGQAQDRAERLSAIGAMTAEFAHQVRTPLAAAMLYAGQLDTSDSGQARIANKILAGLAELKRMVDDMLGFAAGARADQESVNVQALFSDICECMHAQLKPASNLRVSVTDPGLTICANKDAIKGALLNLVTNADQASDDGVNILLHGHQFGNNIHLCVTDDGPGIPADVQPRLFDAFFTTRPQGTGLGLSVVQAVVAAHRGKVSVNSSGLGSSFTLQLPLLPHGDSTS